MEAQGYIQRLTEISKTKLTLLEELLSLSKSQNENARAGKFEELEALLPQKQERMDAIDKLDEQFVVYSQKVKSVLSLDSFEGLAEYDIPGTAELKELVSRIHQKLKDIKTADDESTALVKAELRETKGRIDHTNKFRRVTGAYYPVKNEAPSYYFDRKK